jgi:hypothetical protein
MKKSRKHLAALLWASKGVPVFPTQAGSKIPLSGSKAFKDATTDINQIDIWWTTNPEFNVAASPDAAGCCVLDIDSPEAFTDLELEFGELPDTFTVQTPSGNWHLWFKGNAPPTQSTLIPHVDTRGQGSYVLLPPSEVDGKFYKITSPKGTEVAALPPTIAERLLRKAAEVIREVSEVAPDLPASIQRAREVARGFSAGDDPSAGDEAAFVHACELREFSLTPLTLAKVLQDEWNVRLRDPLPADRLFKKVENAMKYGQNIEGAYAVPPATELFADLVKNLPASQMRDKSSKFALLDEDAQGKLPDPEWLLPDVLPAKATAVLFAPSKAWKTFLALDWALTIAAGLDKWGKIDARPVVYVAAEGASGLAKLRRPAWKLLHSVTKDVPFYVVQTMPWISKPTELVELCEAIKAKTKKPALVILDTLARSMVGLDESSAKDASIAIDACELLKRALDCTILVLHHTGKDAARGMRGSSALMAGFDTGIELVSDKDNKIAEVWAKWHKDAETRNHPWQLKAETVQGSLVFRMANEDDLPVDERLRAHDIGILLEQMGVTEADNAVPMDVLVIELMRLRTWPEQKAKRLFRALSKTGKLAAYEASPGFYYCPLAPAEEF